MGPSKAQKSTASTSKDVCAWFMNSTRSNEEDEEKSKAYSRIDEGNTKMKGDKEDEDSKVESTKRRSKRLSDKNNEEGSSSTTTPKRPKNEEQLDRVELKENEDDDEDDKDQSDDDDEKTKTDEERCQSDDDEDKSTKTEEERWEAVTPEMLLATLGRNSNWTSASTTRDIVGYLRENYPVCRRDEELTVEVTDKLKCAEYICLVVKGSTTGEGAAERVVDSYRLASPPEKTFLSELEVKEFWSKYKEILRRSRRMDNARMTPSRVSTRGSLRTTNKEKQNKKTTTSRKYQYRSRSPYSSYSSDDSR